MRPPHTPYYIIVRQGRSILIAKRGRCGLVGILGRAAGVAVSRRPRPHKENPWGARASRFVPKFSIVARLAGKSLEKFNGRRGHSGDRRHAPRDARHDLGDRKNDLGDRFSVAQVVFWPFGHKKRAPSGALCALLSKDTTFSGEMQIAPGGHFSEKCFGAEGEFPKRYAFGGNRPRRNRTRGLRTDGRTKGRRRRSAPPRRRLRGVAPRAS